MNPQAERAAYAHQSMNLIRCSTPPVPPRIGPAGRRHETEENRRSAVRSPAFIARRQIPGHAGNPFSACLVDRLPSERALAYRMPQTDPEGPLAHSPGSKRVQVMKNSPSSQRSGHGTASMPGLRPLPGARPGRRSLLRNLITDLKLRNP